MQHIMVLRQNRELMSMISISISCSKSWIDTRDALSCVHTCDG